MTAVQKLLLFALVFLSTISAFGQIVPFEHYSTKEGLPSPEVYDIIQDDWGYVWFSTDHGLSRYNGYEFENFGKKDGLTSNTVFNFFKDVHGVIWCTTFNHTIFSIQGPKPKFSPYKWNEHLQNMDDVLVMKDIYVGKNGDLYLSYLNSTGYLLITSNGKVINELSFDVNVSNIRHNYFHDELGSTFCYALEKEQQVNPISSSSLFSSQIDAPYSDDDRFSIVKMDCTNSLFYGAVDSIFHFSNGKKTSQFIGGEILNMKKMNDSSFWISTRSNGVHLFDKYGHKTSVLLKNKSVSSLFLDSEGSIWASTLDDGVFHFKNKGIKYLVPNRKCAHYVDLLSFKGELWMSYVNGDIGKLNNGAYYSEYEAQINRPSHLCLSPNRTSIVFNSDNSLFFPNKKRKITCGYTTNITSRSKKNEILALSYGAVSSIDLKSNEVSDLYAIKRPVALTQYKGKTYIIGKNRLHAFSKSEKALDVPEILNQRFDALAKFNNHLVLGSRGNGIYIYNGEKVVKHITEKDGLSSDFVSLIYIENSSTLWAGGNNGLNRIKFNANGELSIDRLSYSEGLISNEIRALEILNDTIWVGTNAGLSYFHKNILDIKTKSIDYFLRINGININDSKVAVQSKLELSYDENRIEISFSGVSFDESKKLVYRYRLVGLEKKWRYSFDRTVVYPALPFGEYEFIVQVQGENAKWEEQQQKISICIFPPFWKTLWFQISLAVGIILLIYLFFRFRVLIYNRNLVREMIRQVLKRVTKNEPHIIVKDRSNSIKIETRKILFVKSDRNYLEIHTEDGKHVIRKKLGHFLEIVPDPLEFLRVRRSYIVRIDKVTQKGKKHVMIGDYRIDVGETYVEQLDKFFLD